MRGARSHQGRLLSLGALDLALAGDQVAPALYLFSCIYIFFKLCVILSVTPTRSQPNSSLHFKAFYLPFMKPAVHHKINNFHYGELASWLYVKLVSDWEVNPEVQL